MNENDNLSTIREELEKLNSRIDELAARLSNVEAGCSTVAPVEITEPIDIMWEPSGDVNDDAPVETVQNPQPEVETEESILETEPAPAPAPKEESAPAPAKPTVAKTMTTGHAWQTAKPLPPISNILSGISLRDRGPIINTLFREDAKLFIDTVTLFNGMSSLSEAEEHISQNFPEWNLDSKIVREFMMAVRRKLN